MKVLFVDDMPIRLKNFREMMNHACPDILLDIRFFESAESVTLEDFSWADLACLDHDMCEAHYGEFTCPKSHSTKCTCETGFDLVNRVKDLEDVKRPYFTIVHSLNGSGAERMVDTLIDHGWHVTLAPCVQWNPLTMIRISQLVNRYKDKMPTCKECIHYEPRPDLGCKNLPFVDVQETTTTCHWAPSHFVPKVPLVVKETPTSPGQTYLIMPKC